MWASLNWQSSDDVPKDSLLPGFPGTVKHQLRGSPGTEETSRFITGELRALNDRDLTTALDIFLRSLTSGAALTDAVLETNAFRLASPKAAQCSLVCDLARELWAAGFHVTFGPSGEPVTDADIALGTADDNGALEDFISKSESWETTPRHP